MIESPSFDALGEVIRDVGDACRPPDPYKLPTECEYCVPPYPGRGAVVEWTGLLLVAIQLAPLCPGVSLRALPSPCWHLASLT